MSESSPKNQKKEWGERICKQRESGLCIEEWCRQNKLSSHIFHYWKKRLFPKKESNKASFTELLDVKGCIIDIQYRDAKLRVESPTLKQCLQILTEIKC